MLNYINPWVTIFKFYLHTRNKLQAYSSVNVLIILLVNVLSIKDWENDELDSWLVYISGAQQQKYVYVSNFMLASTVDISDAS